MSDHLPRPHLARGRSYDLPHDRGAPYLARNGRTALCTLGIDATGVCLARNIAALLVRSYRHLFHLLTCAPFQHGAFASGQGAIGRLVRYPLVLASRRLV